MESAQDFLERPYASQEHSGNAVEQGTSSGRTYLEPSAPTMEMTFEPCSKKSARPMFQCLHLTSGQEPAWSEAQSVMSAGGCWIPNFSESPSSAVVSSLSQITEEVTDVPTKYFLSIRTCKSILKRAERRKIGPFLVGDGAIAAPLKQSQGLTVRRFTPLECERLQGLPEGWTQDGAEKDRLQALGNGMAQPCADFVMAGIAHYATLAEAAGMLRQEHRT